MIAFLLLAFAISSVGYAGIRLIPAARSPERLAGLPFWLVMVWGPSLAAILLSYHAGHLPQLLRRLLLLAPVPWPIWVLVMAPILMVALLRPWARGETVKLGMTPLAGLVLFNLILGPLGEELGWRGTLQDHWAVQMGWFGASLAVGGVWMLWHLPLWTIASPQAQIALPLFAGHVMLYSVIIGAAHAVSGGSLLPAVMIHLTVNLAANLAVFAGFTAANDWFRASLLPYLVLACAATLLAFRLSAVAP